MHSTAQDSQVPREPLRPEGTPSSATFAPVVDVNLTRTARVLMAAAAAMANNEADARDERGVCVLTASIAA